MNGTSGETPATARAAGLECRKCGCRHFRVLYTRPAVGKLVRRRECRHCGTRVTTWEQEIATSSRPAWPATSRHDLSR